MGGSVERAGWHVVSGLVDRYGVLVCWFVSLLVCWLVGLLVSWFVGLLVCFVCLLACLLFLFFFFALFVFMQFFLVGALLYESPGGNQVDGLPPAQHLVVWRNFVLFDFLPLINGLLRNLVYLYINDLNTHYKMM